MLKLNYFLADIFILSAEKQPIKLSWRQIEWLQIAIRILFGYSVHVIVKTCSDICFTIGQKNCQMFVAKLHTFHHPHNRMRFYPAHSVLSFPDFAVDTFLPQRFLR